MEELAQESRWKGRVPAWGTGTLRGGRREQAHDGGLVGLAQGVEAVTEGATEIPGSVDTRVFWVVPEKAERLWSWYRDLVTSRVLIS